MEISNPNNCRDSGSTASFMNWLVPSAANRLPCSSSRKTASDTPAWIQFPKNCSEVLKKTSNSWSMGTLSSCIRSKAQSRTIAKTWEVISAEHLTLVKSSTGKAAKVSCRQLTDPHTPTQSQLKEQGSVRVQRILRRAERLQAASELGP